MLSLSDGTVLRGSFAEGARFHIDATMGKFDLPASIIAIILPYTERSGAAVTEGSGEALAAGREDVFAEVAEAEDDFELALAMLSANSVDADLSDAVRLANDLDRLYTRTPTLEPDAGAAFERLASLLEHIMDIELENISGSQPKKASLANFARFSEGIAKLDGLRSSNSDKAARWLAEATAAAEAFPKWVQAIEAQEFWKLGSGRRGGSGGSAAAGDAGGRELGRRFPRPLSSS